MLSLPKNKSLRKKKRKRPLDLNGEVQWTRAMRTTEKNRIKKDHSLELKKMMKYWFIMIKDKMTESKLDLKEWLTLKDMMKKKIGIRNGMRGDSRACISSNMKSNSSTKRATSNTPSTLRSTSSSLLLITTDSKNKSSCMNQSLKIITEMTCHNSIIKKAMRC